MRKLRALARTPPLETGRGDRHSAETNWKLQPIRGLCRQDLEDVPYGGWERLLGLRLPRWHSAPSHRLSVGAQGERAKAAGPAGSLPKARYCESLARRSGLLSKQTGQCERPA